MCKFIPKLFRQSTILVRNVQCLTTLSNTVSCHDTDAHLIIGLQTKCGYHRWSPGQQWLP